MEENDKAVEYESNEISEENLEEVAGGNGDSLADCYFVPKKPFNYLKYCGGILVECSSRCLAGGQYCRCHGRVYCRDRMHIVEQDKGNPQRWYAQPKDEFNHSASDKIIDPMHV